jgi:ABC-2 type transport system ATP-binding protein
MSDSKITSTASSIKKTLEDINAIRDTVNKEALKEAVVETTEASAPQDNLQKQNLEVVPSANPEQVDLSAFEDQLTQNGLKDKSFALEQYQTQYSTRPVIEVENLIKMFGSFIAVNNISLTVNRGEIFGILGPNGAGKTTTMEIMETIVQKTSGSVRIDGLDVDRYPFEIRKRIGVQLQSTGFFPELTLVEILELFADIYNISISPVRILESISLSEKANSTINQLSKGQQQRFSLATCLISQPKIVFLDEPTTGLDPQARRSIWYLIKQLKSQGVTVVLTTHYMEEAEVLCDRIAIMDSGKILEINTIKGFVDKLLLRGFTRQTPKYMATLDDVFIDLTGKNLRE